MSYTHLTQEERSCRGSRKSRRWRDGDRGAQRESQRRGVRWTAGLGTSLAVAGFGMQLQPKCPNDFKDCVEARDTLAGKRLVKAFAGQPGIACDL